jgi:putative ABC transport system permease protein
MIHRLSGQIRSGAEAVKHNKLRSFWTMLGIVIGVTSVISIVAIGEGVKQQIGGQIHSLGSNLITIKTAEIHLGSGNGASYTSQLSGFSVSGSLTPKDIKTVSEVNGVSSSSPLTLVSGSVKGDGGVYGPGFVLGSSPDLPSLLNQSLAFGAFFSSDETNTNVAVLGQSAANGMFNENVPLGRTFTFHGQDFVVVGIFNQFTTDPFSQQADMNNAIFIPNGIAENISDNTAPTYEILAKANSPKLTKLTASNIQAALSSSHGGYNGFSVATGNQNFSSNNSILDLLTKLTAGVAAISLLVAGIGIMNVMLVSVSERVREIGIRKAVGATNKQILSQFMIEAGMLSFVGGVLGIGLAYLIDISIRTATDLQPVITWQIVVIAAGVSLLVGVVFGSIPAWQASRKDPIDALRAE